MVSTDQWSVVNVSWLADWRQCPADIELSAVVAPVFTLRRGFLGTRGDHSAFSRAAALQSAIVCVLTVCAALLLV